MWKMCVNNMGYCDKRHSLANAKLAPRLNVYVGRYLDTLVAGAGRHSPPVKIIRHIVNEIFMICSDTTRHKHGCNTRTASYTGKLALAGLSCVHCVLVLGGSSL